MNFESSEFRLSPAANQRSTLGRLIRCGPVALLYVGESWVCLDGRDPIPRFMNRITWDGRFWPISEATAAGRGVCLLIVYLSPAWRATVDGCDNLTHGGRRARCKPLPSQRPLGAIRRSRRRQVEKLQAQVRGATMAPPLGPELPGNGPAGAPTLGVAAAICTSFFDGAKQSPMLAREF